MINGQKAHQVFIAFGSVHPSYLFVRQVLPSAWNISHATLGSCPVSTFSYAVNASCQPRFLSFGVISKSPSPRGAVIRLSCPFLDVKFWCSVGGGHILLHTYSHATQYGHKSPMNPAISRTLRLPPTHTECLTLCLHLVRIRLVFGLEFEAAGRRAKEHLAGRKSATVISCSSHHKYVHNIPDLDPILIIVTRKERLEVITSPVCRRSVIDPWRQVLQ